MELKIDIDAGTDASDEDVEKLTRQLRAELLELDVDAIEFVSSDKTPPEGSKAIGPLLLGSLRVTLSHSSKILPKLIPVVQSWIALKGQTKVHLKIGEDTLELANIPSKEMQSIIDMWLSRHK